MFFQGRKTWDSIPAKFKPLAGRINIVISSNPELALPSGTLLAPDFESAIKAARQIPFHDQIFIIGGQSVYAAALASGEVDFISTTRVDIFSRADMCVALRAFVQFFYRHLPHAFCIIFNSRTRAVTCLASIL
jgi:dihydrofolate reductase